MNPPAKTALLALALSLAASQARAGQRRRQEIRLVLDSSIALSSSRPDLSERLDAYAAKEAGENAENLSDDEETFDPKDITTLREASAALKIPRPDLSKGLRRRASEKERDRADPATPKGVPQMGAQSPKK